MNDTIDPLTLFLHTPADVVLPPIDAVSCLQEKDLKQYMDDCGNIMSMSNVKVRCSFSVSTLPISPDV